MIYSHMGYMNAQIYVYLLDHQQVVMPVAAVMEA